MREITIDCRRLQERTAVHAYLQEVLDLPLYYGKNLDALADCLSELHEVRLTVLHPEAVPTGYGHKILQVLMEAGEENPNLQVDVVLELADTKETETTTES